MDINVLLFFVYFFFGLLYQYVSMQKKLKVFSSLGSLGCGSDFFLGWMGMLGSGCIINLNKGLVSNSDSGYRQI
jgi:hypothetical protein